MENTQNILELLNSEDPTIRKKTVDALIFTQPDTEVLAKLCQMITDSDKGVKNSVAVVLEGFGKFEAAKYLVDYISSEEISTRNLAGEILLKIGVDSVKFLEEKILMANDADQKFILDLLGLIGDDSFGKTAIQVMNESKYDNVVLACMEALGNIKYEDSVSDLIKFFDKNELYHPTIIEALGKIGSSEALDFMMKKYDQVDELTKFSIIEGLAVAGDINTFFFLLNKLYVTTGPLVWALINTIAALKERFGVDVPYDERIRNLILRTISEGEEQFRNAAVTLAVNFHDLETTEQLLKIYGSDYMLDELIKENLHQYPQNVLTKVPTLIKNQPNNLKEILFLLIDIFENFSQNLTEVPLHNLNDALTQCITNPDEEVRRIAIEMLFKLDEEIALLFIDSMLGDENMWNRLKLVEILQFSKNPIAEDALLKLQEDPEQMVSDTAKQIISERQSEIQK